MDTKTASPYVTVRLDVDDSGVAWLELNRPDAGNARNQQMREELLAVYDRVTNDHDVRVLVLTAVGERFFCAGMDLKEAGAAETPVARRRRLNAGRDIDVLAALPVPTIAAINGYALGGGLEMALACDLRIAAAEAQLGLPEITHGLIPGGGATQRLPLLIGPGRAFELLYLGERISGQAAADMGLVNRCVPRADLRQATSELASRIAQANPVALRLLKEAVHNGLESPPSAARGMELELLLTLLAERAAGT
jgi:3-hydroxypropionyl-coenzyme A dehydratase